MNVNGKDVELFDIQNGYAELYYRHECGFVFREDVRVSLNLETGEEKKATRWFSEVDGGCRCGPLRMFEVGYATRREAIEAFVEEVDRMEELGARAH